MGGAAKGLVRIGDETILRRVRRVLSAGCADVAISIGSSGASWLPHEDASGLEVLHDAHPGGGPLAGFAAAMQFMSSTQHAALITAPWDCPFLPVDLVERLQHEAERLGRSVIVEDDERTHPSIALWLREDFGKIAALFDSGERRLHGAAKAVGAAKLLFVNDGARAFFNVNTAEDLMIAQGQDTKEIKW